MSFKESNEITVKIKCDLEHLYRLLIEKDFKIINKFHMDDIYFIPDELDISNLSTREIVSKAILIRNISSKISNRNTKKLTYKIKEINEKGEILNQESINCDIINIDDAKKLLNAIGYKIIMEIEEDDVVYEKDGFEIAIKDIVNGDNLIEIETTDNDEFNSVKKLKLRLNDLNIPIFDDDYFVKKAEIELNKVLGR